MKFADDCQSCGLCKTEGHKQVVWGYGDPDSEIMLIGEAPGYWENEYGVPFYQDARSGSELTTLLWRNGIDREKCYLTNVVKCNPHKDRDPKPDEIKACSQWLEGELAICSPRIILAVGRVATQYFLGKVDMETVHGLPFKITWNDKKFILIPCFHPSAGLRSPETMLRCQIDFRLAAKVFKGQIDIEAYHKDPYEGAEIYTAVSHPSQVSDYLKYHKVVSIDTESINRGETPWLISLSVAPGTAQVMLCKNSGAVAELAEFCKRPDVTTLIHNSLYDLPILEKLGIEPSNMYDTMVMAYLLQSEPQGLKDLAFRYCAMKMKSYEDMISMASAGLAEDYLKYILSREWPDPDPILEIRKDGSPHIKRPQNVSKMVKRLLKKDPIELYDAWNKKDPESGKSQVEAELGPMPMGDLSMIPIDDAIRYSARDADATIRVYPFLWKQLEAMNMSQVFHMDVQVIPMVKDMMEVGILVDVGQFEKLGEDYASKLLDLEIEINRVAGEVCNPRSILDIQKLLFKTLKLKQRDKKQSTGDKILAKMMGDHPVVKVIREHRMYSKLKSTYADKLPKQVGEDGRIHSTFRITRTTTGRLSSANPNLQNQPTKGAEGKALRNGFIAKPGCSLVANDFSQIEMRILAHESQDPKLLEIFSLGLDIHSQTASAIFQVPVDQVDSDTQRRPAKTVGFGIVYGVQAIGLREQLLMLGLDPNHWTLDRCSNLIRAWFGIYKGVRTYMDGLAEFARLRGYVQDMFGRIRYTPLLKSSDERMVAEALRQAGNQPIQAGAQGIIKKAMAELTPLYREIRQSYYIEPLIQIHDDLLFEVEDSIIDRVIPLIQHIMCNVVKLSVPVEVESKVGKKWGSMEKWKN